MQPSTLSQGLDLVDVAVHRERSGRPPFPLSRLADAAQVERSRASRLSQELRALDYLALDESQTLRAGSSYFATAASVNRQWLGATRVVLRSLAARFDVSARICARAGAGVLLLRYENGVSAAPAVRPGMMTPVWCTGAGRALLWDLSDDEVSRLLRDVELVGVGGPRAPHTVAEVLARLGQDREAGHVFASQEYEQGMDEWATPLVGGDGGVLAALSVVSRPLPARSRQALVSELEGATARIHQLLLHAGA